MSRQASPKSSNTDICKYCNQPINKNNTKDLVVLKDIPEKGSYPTDTKSNNSSSVSLNSRRFCEKCSRPLGEELNSKSVQPINSKNLCEKCAASLKKSVQEKPSNPMKSTSVCAKCSKSITEIYDKDKKNTNNNEELCQKCKQQIQQTKSSLPSNRKHLCKKCSQRIGEYSSNTPSLTKSKMADKCEKCSQLLNNISEKSFEKRTNISPRKPKSASSVNESFESAKCCNGIEIVTELGPNQSCVPNSDTYIQNDNIANTSDIKSSNENINSASRKNVCVPLKDAIYKNADCVANMQDHLLKSNDLGVTSSLQPDTCAECDADDSQATKTSAKYDIFSRILDVYKACSCKICNCVTSKVNSFKQGRKYCECKPCQCESCELMNENIKGADENKDASNKTTTCKCDPCECIVCKNKITTETETCACKPCKCEKCVHGNKNQNYTVGHTVLMAVGEQNQMQNPCKCAPCECLNCQSRPTIVQPVLMTNEMSTCIAVHPNCHCDLATCPQATCLPDDQPACSCVRASRVMQKPTTGHNDREFDVHIASVPTRDINNHRLNTFKELLAENEDFDRNYPEKSEYGQVRSFVYNGHHIDSIVAKPRNINRLEESYFPNLRTNFQDYNLQYLRTLPPSKQYLTNDIFGHEYLNFKESSNPRHSMVQRLSYNNKRPEKLINHKYNKRDLTPRYYLKRRDTIRSNDAIVNSMFETRRTINGDMEYESSNIVKSSFSSHTSDPTSLEPTLKTYSLFDINTCPPAESLIAEYELCEPEISDKVLTKKSIDSTNITQESIGKTVQDTTNIQVELSDKFNKTVCEIKACNARLESTVREAKYFTEIMTSMLRKFEILNQEIQNIASQLLSNRYRW
ncbi:uncharacterized protein LOC119692565 [Plutella xylostella]|uniref:uncharacterized protein LOC119692565 n=1 Tax=Plutella xylostella TaxID=51655 RepID=UPI002032A613|nr:uncharacterized protein LOC119692565 [Plutella xylostella]